MPEYGNMVQTLSTTPEPSEALIVEIKRLIDYNYKATRAAHPEWKLPEQWVFCTGPVTQAWDYEDCAKCHGDGKWVEYDADDEWEEVSCQECDGQGMIAVKLMDPPRWVMSFGWYVNVLEVVSGKQA